MRPQNTTTTRNHIYLVDMIYERLKVKQNKDVSLFGETIHPSILVTSYIAYYLAFDRAINQGEVPPDYIELTYRDNGNEKVCQIWKWYFGKLRSQFPLDDLRVQKANIYYMHNISDYTRLKALFLRTPLDHIITNLSDKIKSNLHSVYYADNKIDKSATRKYIAYIQSKFPELPMTFIRNCVDDYSGNTVTLELSREDQVDILRALGYLKSSDFDDRKLSKALTEARKYKKQDSTISILDIKYSEYEGVHQIYDLIQLCSNQLIISECQRHSD